MKGRKIAAVFLTMLMLCAGTVSFAFADDIPSPEQPVVEEPAETEPAAEPAGEEPTQTEPVAEPAVEEPVVEEPVVEETTGEEPVAEEPAETEPAGEEPAETEPAGEEPAGEQPTEAEPTGEEPAEETAETEPVAEPTVEETTGEEAAETEPAAEPTGEEPAEAEPEAEPVVEEPAEETANDPAEDPENIVPEKSAEETEIKELQNEAETEEDNAPEEAPVSENNSEEETPVENAPSAEEQPEKTEEEAPVLEIPEREEELVPVEEKADPGLQGKPNGLKKVAQFRAADGHTEDLEIGSSVDLKELVIRLGYEGEAEFVSSSNPDAFDFADGQLILKNAFLDETLEIRIGGQLIEIPVHDPATVKVGTNEYEECSIEEAFKVQNESGVSELEITLTGDCEVENGRLKVGYGKKVILDLNGYVLRGRENSFGSVITVEDGGTFTLIDGNLSREHRMDSSLPKGGVITGGNASSYDQKNGGGVYVEGGGTFTMEAGTIYSNTAQNNGGGVYVDYNGTFTMTGGRISKNTAQSNGGGVYVKESGKFTMTGGEIGGRINGESGNTAQNGCGVYADRGSSITLGGTAKIWENRKGNTDNNLYLSSSSHVQISQTASLQSNAQIGVTTQNSPDLGPVVVASNGTSDNKQCFHSDNNQFIIDLENGVISLAVPVAELSSSGYSRYTTVQKAIDAVGKGGTGSVRMLRDSTENITIEGKTITLDLDGHVLNGGNTNSVIKIKSNATLTLKDSNTLKLQHNGIIEKGLWKWDERATKDLVNITGGIITGGKDYGVGIISSTGKFIMTGGTIAGNPTDGGVRVTAGTFEMTGGEISGNTASQNGGGVYINSGSTFKMTGDTAKITGNHAGNHGGGVYDNGSFEMTGGEISGNTATYYGGGVYIDTSGTVTLGGTAEITGNHKGSSTVNNLHLYTDKKVTVSTAMPLASGANIGVTTFVAPTETSKVAITGENSADYSEFFASDNPADVVFNDSNVLKLALPVAQLGTDSTAVKYATVQKAIDAAGTGTTASTVKMLLDSTENVVIGTNQKIILDLDGHILNGGSAGSVITVSSSADLTLTDGTPSATHTGLPAGGVVTGGKAEKGSGVNNSGTFTMSGGTISGNTATKYGGGVYNNGTFTMNGGTIGGAEHGKNSAAYGGGVYNDGTFTMNSGSKITGNTASDKGGGVCFNGGTFTMNGDSELSNNTAASDGGGVYVTGGTFTKNGDSKITGNTATSNGGGVYVNSNAQFTMNAGTITGNTAKNGGGVYNSGTFTMTGGTITGDSALGAAYPETSGGGGVNNSGTFTMSGGEISGNSTPASGGGVFNFGTFTMTKGTITGNTADTFGGGVYQVNGNMTVGGSAQITGNHKGSGTDAIANNLFLISDMTVSVSTETDKKLASGAYIGVTTADAPTVGTAIDVTSNGSKLDKQYFHSDNSTYSIVFEKNDASSPAEVLRLAIPVAQVGTDDKYSTVQKAIDEAGTAESTVMMLRDSTEIIKITGKTITLDLDGHVLNGGGSTDSVINIDIGAALTLKDSNTDNLTHKGYIDGNGLWHLGDAIPEGCTEKNITGGIITGGKASTGGGVNNSGTFTMTGGTIAGNTADVGGGVFNKGSFSMNGDGEITDNTAFDGGGVYNCNQFAMANGTISGNTATNDGGGVYTGNGTFTMNGGTISGNTAANNGGGVYIYSNGTFTMSSGTITGNTANYGGGLYIYGKFTMTGGTIGGTDADKNTAFQGGGVYNSGQFTMANGTITGNTATNGGGVYTGNGSFAMTGGTISGNTAASNGGGVYIDNGAFTMSGGTITDNTANNGGGLYIYGKFTMSNGTITGNTAAYGGGVYVSGNGTFEMSGTVTVTGNKLADGTVNNVYLSYSKKITIIGDGLTADASVGVTSENDPKAFFEERFASGEKAEAVEASKAFFFSDKDFSVRFLSDGDHMLFLYMPLTLGDPSGTSVYGDDESSAGTGYTVFDKDGNTVILNPTSEIYLDINAKAGVGADGKLVIRPYINDGNGKKYLVPGEYPFKATMWFNGTSVETDGTYTVGKRPVTVSGITAVDRVYDGTTSVILNLSGAVLDGMVSGDDLTASATGTLDSKDAGTYTVTISGLLLSGKDAGSYELAPSGQQTETTVAIFPKTADENNISAEAIPDQTYTGKAIEPDVVLKDLDIGTGLVRGTDFDVSYSDNVNVGKATVTVSFKGNYLGTKTLYFTVAEQGHIHDWRYAAGGSTVSASCGNEGCDVTENLSLTIHADSAVYDGNPHGAVFTGKALAGLTELPAISYFMKDSNGEYSIAVKGVPTEIGNYLACFTVKDATGKYMYSIKGEPVPPKPDPKPDPIPAPAPAPAPITAHRYTPEEKEVVFDPVSEAPLELILKHTGGAPITEEEFASFVVMIDGKVLSAENSVITVAEDGSTVITAEHYVITILANGDIIITISADYLKTLEAGKHNLFAEFSNSRYHTTLVVQ